MERHRKVFRIPKDPRTENTIFISEIPLDLIDAIAENEWKSCIDQINQVFLDGEKPSFWNFLKLIFVIPAFYKIETYDKAMEKALSLVNLKLQLKGLKIEDPSANGYTELVVIYNPKHNSISN